MRADEIQPGYTAPSGSVAEVVSVLHGAGPHDGIVVVRWSDGVTTYSEPWQQMKDPSP